MKVIVAPDKFKGSLSATEAALAIKRGVHEGGASIALVHLIPMADGGEGTVEALLEATGGDYREVVVSGPLGDPLTARFGLLGDLGGRPSSRWHRPRAWSSSRPVAATS